MSSETASIIDDLKRLLDDDASITLVNIYKEVPIVHRAFIRDVRAQQAVFETDEIQICAIHLSGNTVIEAAGLSAPIEAKFDCADIRRNMVTVSGFRNTELPSQRRATVRVRLKKPLRVTLRHEAETIPGVIDDISLGGCRVRTGRNRPEAGDVTVQIELDGQQVLIAGKILRVIGAIPSFECAIVFELPPKTEQMLSLFVHKRELEIIKELQGTL